MPQWLSQAPHRYSCDWVNYRHCHSLAFAFGPASFHIPDLQNYLTGLLKTHPLINSLGSFCPGTLPNHVNIWIFSLCPAQTAWAGYF